MGGGWWVACEIILLGLGVGVLSIFHSHFPIFPFPFLHSHFPIPIPSPQSQSQSLDNFITVSFIKLLIKIWLKMSFCATNKVDINAL